MTPSHSTCTGSHASHASVACWDPDIQGLPQDVCAAGDLIPEETRCICRQFVIKADVLPVALSHLQLKE